MSTGQEEMPPAKPDDDTETKSSNEAAKIPSTDEVDHSKDPSLEKKVLKPLEDANKNTDSGFKDLGSESTEKKSSSDNTDDNSEFELKWDDDESDEQSIGPSEKVQAGENDKTKADVDGTTLSGTDIIDENKLLESSPSNNKDTVNTSPSNSTEEETAITDDVGEIVDENKLLEGPESDEVDEEKLLLESDDNRDDFPSKDVNTDSVKTDISKANEKLLTSTKPDVPPLDQASNAATENVTSDSDFQDAKSKELLSNEELKVDPSKIFACETITKLINEHTSPIDSPTPSSSSNNSSSIDATDDINTEHGLNKPDMMLEIPTQEIIELFDETDSISTQNDDEMEVDDASPKTATVDDKKPVAEEKSDVLILEPSDMCKDLDTENQKGCDELIIKDVSEDDWCEIERRLEGFEDSFKASQLNQKSKEPEKDDAKERKGKTEETENLPLTDAQKMVIETENKALLKTLQDSVLDSTAELTSASMNVDDDDESTSHLEDELLTESPKPAQDIDTAVKELEDAVKEPENAVVSETVSQSAPSTTQEDIINSGKEINADSNLDNQKLDSKSDNIPSEVTQEIQSESKTTQPDIASPKTDQPSNKDTIELANETKIDDKLPTSNIEDTPESVIQQSSTEVALPVAEPTKTCSPADLNDDEVSSTQEPVKTISPSKLSDNVDTSVSVEEERDTSTIKPVDIQVADKIEVDVNPLESKLPTELEAKIQDATVPPSTAKPNEIEDAPSTAENTEKDSKLKDSEELVKASTVDDNTSTIDDKTSTTDEKTSTTDDKASSTNDAKISTVEAEPTKVVVSPEGSEVTKAQPSVVEMDVELTNEDQTKTIDQSPTLPKDSEVSKIPDENAQQSMEIDQSTEVQVPLTTTNASSTEESAEKTVEELVMEVDSITSVVEAPAIAKDNELPISKPETTSDNIELSSKELQPSTSANLELSPKEPQASTSDVTPTSKHDDETPSTSKADDETPSTSKTDVEPSTSAENTKPVSDPDSDEVTETSDSLGLLAESSRVMEDDDDQDDDDDADNDADDDDDYDPEDESSNQMTAEHSEDSNAPCSETEAKQDPCIESPGEEKAEFSFAISDVFSKQEKEIEETDVVQDQIEDQIQDDIEVTADEVAVATIDDVEATIDDVEATIDDVEATIDDVEATIDDVEATIDDVEATIDDVQAADDTAIEQKEEDKDESNKQADIETVKLSDTSDNEAENESMLKKLLGNDEKDAAKEESVDKTEQKNEEPSGSDMNIVELEESSSEDDIQEVKKASKSEKSTLITVDGLNITIPGCVEVSNVKVAHTPDVKEAVIQGTDDKTSAEKPKPKFSLEIFSLDSDEEDSAPTPAVDQKPAEDKSIPKKCINMTCTSTCSSYYKADASCVAYYKAQKKKKALVCAQCADVVVKRNERLIQGIKDLTPLLNMDTIKAAADVVELSDSESEDEDTTEPETLGETGASLVEASLAQLINETWDKFRMDSRLHDAEVEMTKEMEKLQEEGDKIKAMLNECQVATDKLRNDLYATFEYQRRERDAIIICDTPLSKYSCLEYAVHQSSGQVPMPENRVKRRLSSANEVPAKRPAIPLGYSSLDGDTAQPQIQTQTQEKPPPPTIETTKQDDDKDIAVLKVSVEAAPSDLPPPGELVPPPLRAGLCVYAMRNSFGCWIRSKVLEVNGKSSVAGMSQSFTMCRVKYDHKPKGSSRLFPARCLAYNEPANVRLTIGTRIIALFKDAQNPLKKDAFYSGIIAEVPNPVNNYRYLVFFDDGYAQYVRHRDTRVVCESSALVWEEVHPFSREFVKEYLIAYPERPMVRLHAGQSLKTEWNGKWWASRVVQVDASLVQVHFEEDNRSEWIYRGSTRLAPLFLALQRKRARPMPRTKAQPQINMPYVEYTRSEEQNKSEPAPPAPAPPSERENRQRAVAKKSTALPPAPHAPAPPPVADSVTSRVVQPPPAADSVTSRVVYYTPKKVVTPLKMITHNCGAHCKRKDVLALKDLRTYNPLAKPLLSGWERQIVRYKGHKEVMYKAPCGRRLRNMRELHRYLRLIESDMAVDLFDFTPHTHCLAEFVLNKCLVGKKDLSHGRENVPVPCVNYYDESLPEFCSYNTERTPTAGVPLNLDPEFLCGCDCTDDCEDKSKCACWQLTLEGARTIGLGGPRVGYEYKRLPEPLPSGIYECNSRCKCKHTCLNRVAQHPLQLKLQVFKTLNRGWGIRALNDVPKGSFLCVYAGNLLTDATANMDGLNEGDEYLAELDYIEVVEGMKEGYEEDIPEADKRLDKKNVAKDSEESEMSSSEEEDETPSKNEQEDGDFCPGIITSGVTKFSKRLRKREKNKKKKEEEAAKEKDKEKDGKSESDFITISDDEEVREPSHFMAQAGMGRDFISKYKSVRSYFGKDEACYIMDAKVQGNIGRYLNHSCQPNVFVQNVFVDTHDPRFPWVAFFALSHIKAGTELTWNYNYDVGSVPGKVLYCYCGATNCRGRLL